jgi:lactoylglutathione lyase
MSASVITGIRTVSVPVDDRQQALRCYVDTLGFTVLRDAPIPTGRWIELAPGGTDVIIALEPARRDVTRGPIMIRFTTADAAAAHAALSDAGVDTDDIIEWPGLLPMFALRDPDGNTFSITETSTLSTARKHAHRPTECTSRVLESAPPVPRTGLTVRAPMDG